MPRLLLFTVAVLSTIGFVTPVFSADLPVQPRPAPQPAQPAPQVADWSGGQVGGNAGGSIGNNNFVEPGSIVCFDAGCPETPFEFDGNPGSFVGGIFIGYRWQMGNSVFGVEGDATWQELETSKTQSTVTELCCGYRSDFFNGSIKQQWEGSIRARYGWLVTPVVLVYATGGVSFGEISGSFSYTGTTATASVGEFGGAQPTTVAGSGSWNDTRVGFTVGAGVESDVSNFLGIPGAKTRFEYRFTSYGNYSKDVPLSCSGICTDATAPSSNAHIDLKDIYNHKFMFGLGFELPG